MPAAWTRSSGIWPDAREQWKEMRRCVGQRLFDVLRRRWRLAPQYGGMEVEKRADEWFKTVVERRDANNPVLEPHEVVTEQPPLTLQLADKRRQVTRMNRFRDLLHDVHLPQADNCCLPGDLPNVSGLGVDKGLDEGEPTDAPVDLPAELGIEGNRWFEQESVPLPRDGRGRHARTLRSPPTHRCRSRRARRATASRSPSLNALGPQLGDDRRMPEPHECLDRDHGDILVDRPLERRLTQ